MAITKEQWVEIENELAGTFGNVVFSVGDHKVSVQRQRKSESTTVLSVYIDDFIRGEWCNKKESRPACLEQVWRKRSISLYKPTEIKRIQKTFGKRDAKKHFPKLHDKTEYFDCSFTTSKSLVRQFKRIENIELELIGGISYESMEA